MRRPRSVATSLPGARSTRQGAAAHAWPVSFAAVLGVSGLLVAACGGGAVHNGAAGLAGTKPTTTQRHAPARAGSSRSSAPTEAQLLEYSKCIRAHGVKNFPDPERAAGGGFAFRAQPGLDPRSPSPQFKAAEKACQGDVPAGTGPPVATSSGRASSRAGAPGVTATARATVTVNPAQHYQSIAGFGVSEGFGQAKTLMRAPSSVQQRVISLLYSPTQGAGLTILRNEISADAGFTIEPKAPTSPSAKPSYLTLSEIDQDQGQLWFAKRVKADYGVSDVFADAWSAPGFMKTNGSAIRGGTVCGAPGTNCKSGDWRQAYANYLVQYAKDYAAAGVPLSYMGPENETTIAPPQDSMLMSPVQTANLMTVLGPTLARSGLSTRAECCASIGWDYAQEYVAAIEADKVASSATAVFTSHGYFVPPASPLEGWPKPVWQTEWAPFGFGPWDPSWDDGSPSSGFTWAQDIYTGLTAADLGAFLYLWGADTMSLTGPNTGLVYVKGGTVATSGRLWAFAGYSRFVRPGALRIATRTSAPGLEVSAFRNRDGSVAVVVLNSAKSTEVTTFSLRGLSGGQVTPYLTDASHGLTRQNPITMRDGSFTGTVPPRSLVSYDIRS